MATNINPQHLLTRHNYRSWSRNIKIKLESEGLIVWIDKKNWPQESETEKEKLPPISKFKLEQSKAKTCGLIKSYCSPDICLEINHLDDPAEIWQILKTSIGGTTSDRSYRISCLKEFKSLKKLPEEELPTFIARIEDSCRRLEDIGENISEDYKCYALIENLPIEYDYLAREIENYEQNDFKFLKIKSEILKEYTRRNLREETKVECLATENLKPNIKFKVKCEFCNKLGHSIRECKKKQRIEDKVKQTHGGAFITESNVSEFLNSGQANEILTRKWTLDSASTSHIYQNREFFTEMRKPQNNSAVKMGITPHEVEGIGTVKFTIKEGQNIKTVTLFNTLYVPTIHRNLISMSKMDKAGMHAKLDHGFKIFSPHWKYLWSAKLKDNFYVIKGLPLKRRGENEIKENKMSPKLTKRKIVKDGIKSRKENKNETIEFAYSVDKNDIMIWHERLGHCNIPTIKKMFNESLVEPSVKLKGEESRCEPCIYGKNTRAEYPRSSNIRSTEILQLIHTDVWGPAPTPSKHGFRYILTFLDDYSRRSFCYAMRTKDEVCTKLKSFIEFIERQTGKKIRAIRSDNGLEYCCRPVEELLGKLGIRHERTNTYSPQMNGSAERLNRVLFDGMRTLLQSSNIPENLWLEAVHTINYIRNRIFHRSINDIPFKRWYGRKPTLKHLKRYGCIAYVHIPQQKRNKFQPRAKKGIMIGYGMRTRGYRIWIPEEDTIIESKHVTFNEEKLGIEKDGQVVASEFDDDDELTDTNVEDQSSGSESSEQEPQPSTSRETELKSDQCVTFRRYTKTRKKGKTKGQEDIYVFAPDGKTLRSNIELENYCKEHNINYDPSLDVFSKYCQITNDFSLKRKDTEEVSSEEEANCAEIIIPRSPREAKKLPEAKEWKKAMDMEIDMMIKRQVWEPVPKPNQTTKILGTKWVYTLKNKDKSKRFKARLVALGNNQTEGQDYEETFSPVVNFVLIRLFMILFICILKWKHSLIDVKCAYLYGNVDKDIYIAQPTDYIIEGKENHVLKLKKALYGLHQAGKCWYEELHNKLITNGFHQIKGLTCVYNYKNRAIVLIYVDDLPVFAKSETDLKEVINLLESIYELENLGPITKLLGINFNITDEKIIINCPEYINSCLKKFKIFHHINTFLPLNAGTVTSLQEMPQTDAERLQMQKVPYRSLLGCLLYIAGRCRPDISYAVVSLSQVVENPGSIHWKRLLQILKYLASTKDLGLSLSSNQQPLQLTTYSDASWASDPHDRRSWSGYIIFINNMPLTWRVIKQTCVALSPMESEFIASSESAKDIKYLTSTIKNIIEDLQLFTTIKIQKPILFCDNTASVQFTKCRAENIKNRYIDLRYMFVREMYENGEIDVKNIQSKENIADIMTKALPKDAFLKLRQSFLA